MRLGSLARRAHRHFERGCACDHRPIFFQPAPGLPALIECDAPAALVSGLFTQSENIGNSPSDRKQNHDGPFYFWVISPFAGVQLWTYHCVLSASSLPVIAVELSS